MKAPHRLVLPRACILNTGDNQQGDNNWFLGGKGGKKILANTQVLQRTKVHKQIKYTRAIKTSWERGMITKKNFFLITKAL